MFKFTIINKKHFRVQLYVIKSEMLQKFSKKDKKKMGKESISTFDPTHCFHLRKTSFSIKGEEV